MRKFGIGRLDSFARKVNSFSYFSLIDMVLKGQKLTRTKYVFFINILIVKASKYEMIYRNLAKIKKLSKQESLPKHIKLRMIK